jgi:putative ABC transport system permease protein
MAILLSAWTYGLILALLALGVLVSYRIFRFPDITADGSFTLGAAVSAVLLNEGLHPFFAGLASIYLWPEAWVPAATKLSPLVATPLAFVAGALAGASTGTLHTKFKINPLLSGILVMTGLFSVNLRVMGKSNLPMYGATTLATYAERLATLLTGDRKRIPVLGWDVNVADVTMLFLAFVISAAVGLLMYAFFRTDLGTSMRATGDNDQMIRALGVNVEGRIIAGLALSNGLIAVSGSLYAQKEGFADVGMGIGMIVTGLASVIIGEALVGGQFHLGLAITGAIMGAVLFRLLEALVLRAGMNPNDLKLIRAVFVFVALILPDMLKRLRSSWNRKRAAPLTLKPANGGAAPR